VDVVRRFDSTGSRYLLCSRRNKPRGFANFKTDVISNHIARRRINPAITVPIFINSESNDSIFINVCLLNLVTILKALRASQRTEGNEGAGAYIFKRRTDEGAKIICNLFGSSIADIKRLALGQLWWRYDKTQ